MQQIDTIVIGAGQAGLATSRLLTERGRDHIVLERGRLAERWRSERWDSLRLLTPNWMSRLPGWSYRGPEPDGFMTMPELVDHLAGFARSFAAPVAEETTVRSVEHAGDAYRVRTDQGVWRARHVVVATGHCDVPQIPAQARGLAPDAEQLAPSRYRNPWQLRDGGVLVVGASASGLQIADELRRAGRDVVLAVGRHSRMPRRYRGMDIMWWLDRIGTLRTRVEDVADIEAARRSPSLQLVGDPSGRTLDLAVARASGIRLAGRLEGVDGQRISFADDLARTVAAADRRLRRVLDRIDAHIADTGLAGEVDEPEPLPAVHTAGALTKLDLRAAGITTVLWATGHRRSYPWLRVPVLDRNGDIVQRQGATPSPGLYVVGMAFQNRRNSTFIDGVGEDARLVVDQLTSRSAGQPAAA
jgi:putative flavoprotein involved in K+ transport